MPLDDARRARSNPGGQRSWPARGRPRERLLELGPEALSDAELLALVLGGGGALRLAERVLGACGGIGGLLRARPRQLLSAQGMGRARACATMAAVELARRIEAPPRRSGALSSSHQVYRRLRRRLAFLEHEAFVVLCLDARNQVVAEAQVAQGSATSVEVHPREVFVVAVREAAAAVIVAHNHPSGDPEPSDDDVQLTERLRRAARLLGIPLLDHLVVARRGFVSFAERGLL